MYDFSAEFTPHRRLSFGVRSWIIEQQLHVKAVSKSQPNQTQRGKFRPRETWILQGGKSEKLGLEKPASEANDR